MDRERLDRIDCSNDRMDKSARRVWPALAAKSSRGRLAYIGCDGFERRVQKLLQLPSTRSDLSANSRSARRGHWRYSRIAHAELNDVICGPIDIITSFSPTS